MCKFCDNLEYRDIKIDTRTSLADDNVCEFIVQNDCEQCENGCSSDNNYFSITMWEDNLHLNYYHKIRDLIIAPISMRFSINFCPMCGKRISKELHSDELNFW